MGRNRGNVWRKNHGEHHKRENRKIRSIGELRSALKRDPHAYKTEFEQQYAFFRSKVSVLKLQGAAGATGDSENHNSRKRDEKDLCDVMDFLAHVSPLFKKECADYPKELVDLLENYPDHILPSTRTALVKALILMRNRGFITPLSILPTFFKLFQIQDKGLRKLVFSHVVADIARINKKHKDQKLNRKLQNYMYSLLKHDNQTLVKKSLGIVMELYRKGVWRDTKTVNVVATCLFSKHSAVLRNALRYFLGEVLEMEDEDAEKRVLGVIKTNTKRKRKRMMKLMALQEKQEKRKGDTFQYDQHDLAAIRSLNDPQQMCERLFSMLRKSKEAWDIRELLMHVIARIAGYHEVMLFNFFPWMQKYLKPFQNGVTRLLAYTAQASHKLIPPEVLQPLIKHLANEFVTQNSSPEVMAVGINSIRAICSRQPLVFDDENRDLLHDLVQYQKHKNKGVSVATRALIGLYRVTNPGILMKKDRGREGHIMVRDGKEMEGFGEVKPQRDIPGAELLREAILEAGGEIKPGLPMAAQRILSQEDHDQLKQARIEHLAEKYGRDESEVGLAEDRPDAPEIDSADIESLTVLRKMEREARAEERTESKAEKTWRDYGKRKGGGTTNVEKQRHKAFEMQNKSRMIKNKRKRSQQHDKAITKRHTKKQKLLGARGMRRRV